jgi:MFS family permease
MDDPLPIPGTVQQVDVDHTLSLRHNKEQQDIVLIPRPSSHPDDPLNWSRYRKFMSNTCQMAWCFFAAALISGLSSSYLLISEDTGISVADLSTGNGLMYLFMGWGTLLTQNLAQDFGRRPVFLVGMLGASLLQIWSAYITSVGEWYANRILLGIFVSPQEALIELCIADIHFAHDRGFHMGVYNWTLWCGAFLSPIAGGFVAERFGWRWIQYILAIICLCFTVATFFAFEETMFFRQVNIQEPIFSTPKDTSTLESSHDIDGKMGCESKEPESSSVPPVIAEESYQVNTYAQKLKLWGFRHPSQPFNFFRSITLSFRLLCFPTIIFSGLLVGSILAWYNVLGGSLAEVLGGAPYNFSTEAIGLTYFASVIGVSIGCYFSGWLSDILAIRLARRRHGIKEPEDRLWMFVIPVIAHPLGCLLYGVGASHHIPWIGVVIGIAFICVTLPMGSGLAITYIIDSQKELAGESIVTVILIRNTIGGLQCLCRSINVLFSELTIIC